MPELSKLRQEDCIFEAIQGFLSQKQEGDGLPFKFEKTFCLDEIVFTHLDVVHKVHAQ